MAEQRPLGTIRTTPPRPTGTDTPAPAGPGRHRRETPTEPRIPQPRKPQDAAHPRQRVTCGDLAVVAGFSTALGRLSRPSLRDHRR